MISKNEITAIGKFQKTHALKGELNVILDVTPVFIEEGNSIIIDIDGLFVPFYASSIRPKGTNSSLIKLEGVDSEDEARAFVNKTVYALKSQLAPFLEMEEDELLDDDDLIGYEVVESDSNESIGKIEAVDSSTDNLLFIVNNNDGETFFIPAVDEFIEEIDDDKAIIFMHLPDGLLDLNKKTK